MVQRSNLKTAGDSVDIKGYLNVSSYCSFNADGVSPERVSVGNYGIAGNPTALLGYNASDVTKFVLNAVDGSATFAGANCDINNDGLLRVKRSAPNGSGGLVIYPDNDFSIGCSNKLKNRRQRHVCWWDYSQRCNIRTNKC